MALDLQEMLSETGALLHGHFRLSSGLHSGDYVQCALLLEHPRNAKRVGTELASQVRPMSPAKIVSPALGGVIIGYAVAEALDIPFVFTERKDGQMTLRRGFHLERDEPIVIIEDVVTTGKSTRETADAVRAAGGRVMGFGSILNRSGRENPYEGVPYVYLLAMNLEAYSETICPHCEHNVPLHVPGSRYSR
ncbi:MAG TPA: orotate phosphoribosyltransferase [Thermoanaerobaculia bacterium]|nr:orotate phosphoribosyltransferase [Thermoanaerobaculia bacterium]